ncbi:MAG: hypothetical protein IK124_12245 [Prevotella sp.]|nr:hypothetical protein [Prevotella sp.]
MKSFIKKHLYKISMALVYAGVILLLVVHFLHLRFNNLLFLSLFLILLGIIFYVQSVKHQGRY